MDDEALIFIDETTKCRSYDIPQEEPYQGRFGRIVTTYLDEVTIKKPNGIRYYIVSFLVTGSKKALLRYHKKVFNEGR